MFQDHICRLRYRTLPVLIDEPGSREKLQSKSLSGQLENRGRSRRISSHSLTLLPSCLAGNFCEAHEETVTMPEDYHGTFELFVRWLYTGKDEAFSDEFLSPVCEGWDNG